MRSEASRKQHNQYNRQYYREHKDDYRARQKAHMNQVYSWINEIKLLAGCKDCGYDKNPIALQFDHLRDKVDSISKLIASWADRETLLKEIAKCEVVCANCHFIRTYTRRAQFDTKLQRRLQ